MIIVGLFAFYDQFTWITNKSYRSTIGALGPPNAAIENWAFVTLSVLLLIIGVALFLYSLRRKTVKK